MEWKQEYDLGIFELDEQHREIVGCVLSINQAVTRQDQWSGVHWGLVNLANLSHIHFKVEESLMRIHGYARLEAHTGDHTRFSLLVKKLQERALAGRISQDRIYSLHEWWDEHIRTHDKPYAAEFLNLTVLSKS